MIVTKVCKFIASHQLIKQGDNVLVACSGGPDSLALVDILRTIYPKFGFQLAVAHVDHMFRGEQSAEDAQFVNDYCQRHGLICYTKAINIPQILVQEGGSAQDVGRRLRYQYLREIADAWGGAKIATGHHSDDQVETILLHLFRGSGGTGLGGMQACLDGIIRPLLGITRDEIDQYCQQEQLVPRMDPSNQKPNYLRNRIRLHLLPQLEAALGNRLREPLCRTAKILSDEQAYFKKIVKELLPELTRENDDSVFVDIELLSKQHIALKRHIFRMLIEKKQGNLTGITFHHVEKLIELADFMPVGSKLDLPGGLRAEREYHSVQLRQRIPSCASQSLLPPRVTLRIPGETLIPALSLIVKAEIHSQLPQLLPPGTALFDLSSLEQPLYVRTRLSGDRFLPSGMQGEKKLKNFFIDNKIARRLRDRVPIFCDSQGVIFWVGGLRASRLGLITSTTTQYLTLQILQMQEDNHEYDE